MKKIECKLLGESRMREFAKTVVSMAFAYIDEKFVGDSFLGRKALDLVESLVLKAIDEGLIEDLLSKGALSMPAGAESLAAPEAKP